MRLRMVGDTNIGKRRKINQDSLFYDAGQGLGIVADGIGGRKGGEIASSTAVQTIRKHFQDSEQIAHDELPVMIAGSVDLANKAIIQKGKKDQAITGMGTTVNCLAFGSNKLYIGHIGDSRTYLYFNGNLWQLTVDHSIDVFLKRGWLELNETTMNAKQDALVKAVGLLPELDVDVYEIPLQHNQLFLTCSDGLHGMVKETRIAQIISDNFRRFERIPSLLIKEANKNGGQDNITVLLSHIEA